MMALEDGISHRAFCSLVDDVESLCLVKECRELEGRYGVDFTSKILTSDPEERRPIIKDFVQAIYVKDLALQLRTASEVEHLCKISDAVGWKKLWDHALDHGEACMPLFGIWYMSSAIRNMQSPHVHYVKQQNLT